MNSKENLMEIQGEIGFYQRIIEFLKDKEKMKEIGVTEDGELGECLKKLAKSYSGKRVTVTMYNYRLNREEEREGVFKYDSSKALSFKIGEEECDFMFPGHRYVSSIEWISSSGVKKKIYENETYIESLDTKDNFIAYAKLFGTSRVISEIEKDVESIKEDAGIHEKGQTPRGLTKTK